MSISGIQLRCSTQETNSLTLTAPSGGVVGGAMDVVGDTIVVYHETKDAGEKVAACIRANKILLPKVAGSGTAVAQGGKLYFTDGAAGVTGGSGGTICARALEAAGALATTVLAAFDGTVAA